MHISFFIYAIIVALSLAIITLCLSLSLKLLRLKTNSNSLIKIVGFEALFLILVGIICSITNGIVAALLNLLLLFGGVILWTMLLKSFAPNDYSFGRAMGSYILSYIIAAAITVVIAILGIILFAQVFKINGDSMSPALKANQTVLVYKFQKLPHKGDVVVYKNQETGKQVLGRVQGGPGETVTMSAGPGIAAMSQVMLSNNEYYVTGDNASYRTNNVIEANSIIGVVGPKL